MMGSVQPNQAIRRFLTASLLSVLACFVFLLAGCDNNSSSGAYPNKDIRLIVPFSPGGESDGFAR